MCYNLGMESISWHSLSVRETFKKLSSHEGGLSEREAEKRLKKFGPNKLPEPKRFTRIQIFLRQFKSPFVYLLIVAAVVSFILHDAINGYIIFAFVILTIAFGYFQEQKAERTLEHLEKIVRYIGRVMRDGKELEIEADKLVPGDIVFLASGDKVPADIRLIEVKNFETQEASLTGESMPIPKTWEAVPIGNLISERACMAFMGTIVSRGRALGIVVETGLETEFGKIAQSLATIKEEETPFQKKVGRLAKFISLLLLLIVAGIFIGGLLRGIEFTEIFTASVAVAVAAIPESLVIAVTVILAVGMVRLLRKKALVRKLISAETLGGTTVICTDKTGTLTEGRMKVAEIYSEGQSREFILEIAMIANEAYIENPKEDVANWNIHGDPTERALIEAGIEAGLSDLLLEGEKNILDEIPFESENQYMATLLTQGNPKSETLNPKHNVIYYKGAPEKILKACNIAPSKFTQLEKIYEDFSKKGLRVLALAHKKTNFEKLVQLENVLSDLIFVGFIALKDPLRENVANTIKDAHGAGIKVVMITGDNKYTAQTIALELGLKFDHEKIIEGRELADMDDETLKKQVRHISVYARILPHDKLRIVEAFQANGEVVAMTGDGVNDAPALKKADIGIAMGAGSDVAKEASDMIILDNNFKSIVDAVTQGRVIFDNLRKVITYLFASSFTEIILVAGSIIAGLPLPVVAAQILWINLVEDGLPAFALAYEPKEKDVMKLPPTGARTPILNREIKTIIFIVGIITDFMLLGTFMVLFNVTGNIDYVRTVVFVALGLNSLFYIFSIKSLRRSIFRIDILNNKYLIVSVVFGFLMLLFAIYVPFFQDILRTVPLGIAPWAIIAALAGINLLGIELAKAIFIRRKQT